MIGSAAPAPVVAAHRGASRLAPENTLAAFVAALDAGAAALELDVQLTSDDAVIVLHDPLLDRTTSGSGPVARHRLEEVRALDAGSWCSARFAGERVPLLEEVLEATVGRCRVNVELKGERAEELAEAVVGLLERHAARERAVVMSFDLDAAIAAKRAGAPVVLAIVGQPLADQLGFVLATGLDGLNQAVERWEAATVRRFHDRGLLVHGSLVRDTAELATFAALGGDLADADELELLGGP